MNLDEILNDNVLDKDNISTNEYFFLVACEIGNKEWLQWASHIDNNLKYDMKDHLPFRIACESNNLDTLSYIIEQCTYIEFTDYNYLIYAEMINSKYSIAKCLYEKCSYVFDSLTTVELFDIFTEWCMDDVLMAKWLYDKFPYIPIHKNQHQMFINACNSNYISIARFLVDLKPNCYYICEIDDVIIHWDVEYNLNIPNIITKDEIPYSIENCYICYDESNLMTRCRHFYCVSCLEQHYERNSMSCPYCRKQNIENDLYLII